MYGGRLRDNFKLWKDRGLIYKNHMQQQCQGVQSTKETVNDEHQKIIHAPQQRTREISISIKDMRQIMYTNQTG